MDEPRYIEFEPGEKHAGKKAAISYTMDSFQDCGYLLQDDDVVVDIDCLSRSQINQLLQWFDIKTMRVWTDRGIHLYYKKPPDFGNAISSGLCLLGFKIEQKTKKNTPGGLTVKRDGVERKIENADIRETLPLMFRKRYKGNSLLGMSEGDGRNNELYSLKRALHNCNGWDSILRFVNQHIFAEPLNQDEFASVARQENITEKSKESDIALEIINRLSCVIYNRGIWFKDKGNYISDTKDERLIRRIYDIAGNRTTRSIDEIVKTIEYRAPVIEDVDNGFPIKFKNGILYPSGRFVPMESPEDFTTFTPYCIDIPYYKNAEPVEVVDKYIADLTGGEKEYRDLLLEALGFTFVTDRDTVNALGKFFILRGDGRNGKGTFLRIISTILGKKNCSSLSITQLGDPKYAVNIIGKLANLGDDVEPSAINDAQMKMLKNVSTADEITVRYLYKKAFDIKPTAKLYFTTNADIKSFEKGYAYKRRVVWLPMFNKVEVVDSQFVKKITTDSALEYWVRLMMEGYRRLLNNGWTESKRVKEYNERYHKRNNLMEEFVDEIEYKFFDGKTSSQIREMFKEWNVGDAREFSPTKFRVAIWEKYKAGWYQKRINGPSVRVITLQSDVPPGVNLAPPL